MCVLTARFVDVQRGEPCRLPPGTLRASDSQEELIDGSTGEAVDKLWLSSRQLV